MEGEDWYSFLANIHAQNPQPLTNGWFFDYAYEEWSQIILRANPLLDIATLIRTIAPFYFGTDGGREYLRYCRWSWNEFVKQGVWRQALTPGQAAQLLTYETRHREILDHNLEQSPPARFHGRRREREFDRNVELAEQFEQTFPVVLERWLRQQPNLIRMWLMPGGGPAIVSLWTQRLLRHNLTILNLRDGPLIRIQPYAEDEDCYPDGFPWTPWLHPSNYSRAQAYERDVRRVTE